MFENHDSIETDVHRPETCPVTDRELIETLSKPLVCHRAVTRRATMIHQGKSEPLRY